MGKTVRLISTYQLLLASPNGKLLLICSVGSVSVSCQYVCVCKWKTKNRTLRFRFEI